MHCDCKFLNGNSHWKLTMTCLANNTDCKKVSSLQSYIQQFVQIQIVNIILFAYNVVHSTCKIINQVHFSYNNSIQQICLVGFNWSKCWKKPSVSYYSSG